MFPAPRRVSVTLILLGAILAVSTASIFIRLAQEEGASSLVIAAARLTIATFVLAPLALTGGRGELRALRRGDLRLALLAGAFLAVHFAVWVTSLEFTSVASSVVLVTTTPLWVALFSPLVLRESVGRRTVVGLVLALFGGAIVGLSDACSWNAGRLACPELGGFLSGDAFLGDLLALSGAWMAAGYMLVGRKLRPRMSLVPYVFIVYGMAAVILLILMLGSGTSPAGLPPAAYLWFALLAFVPQLLGHSTFNWALKHAPASFVSVALLGEPVGTTILAYLVFREAPGWIKVGGAAWILAGIWLAASQDGRSNRSEEGAAADGRVRRS
jgi:drug/metabolite transporter (DMT)-like permease